MLEEEKGNFLVKFKEETKIFGITVKGEFIEMMSKSISLLPSVISNELVIATFVPMIPSLVTDRVKQEIFQRHIPDLSQQLFKEQNRLNKDFIASPEGRKLFKDTIEEILKESNEEKIEFLKKFIVNSYVQSDMEEATKKQFLLTLSALSTIELSLLRIFFNPEVYVKKIIEQMPVNSEGNIEFALKENIRNYLNIEKMLYEKAISNLKKHDCIDESGKTTIWSSGVYSPQFKNEVLATATQELKLFITPYGKNFVKFVTREI